MFFGFIIDENFDIFGLDIDQMKFQICVLVWKSYDTNEFATLAERNDIVACSIR